MELTYEIIINKLREGTFTLGHMMMLQRRGLFSKIESLNVSEDEEMSADEQMSMVFIMAEIIYVLIRAPKDVTPEDIAYEIPMDKIDELSEALNVAFEKMSKMAKN